MLAVRPLPLAGLALDTAVASAFVVLYAFELGTAVRHVLLLPVLEAGLLRGRAGAVAVSVLTVPALVLFEWRHPPGFDVGHVLGPFGIALLVGLVVGALSAPARTGARPRPS